MRTLEIGDRVLVEFLNPEDTIEGIFLGRRDDAMQHFGVQLDNGFQQAVWPTTVTLIEVKEPDGWVDATNWERQVTPDGVA